MTKKEREEISKKMYEQYHDTTGGQLSYESIAYKYGCATSTVHRRINWYAAKLVREGEE